MTVTPPRARPAAPTGSPVAAQRLPGPRSDRRPALAALALLLVLGGGLVSGLVVYRSGQRADFLVLARDVAPGRRITDDDLGTARIAGTGARAVPASRRSSVVGEYATAALYAGTLLTPQMVAPTQAVPDGGAVVGIALDTSEAPAGGVGLGDVVRILQVPARGSTGTPTQLVAAARVVGLGQNGADDAARAGLASTGTVVSVLVPADAAAPVAAASVQRLAALVLLPAATKPAVDWR